MSDVAEIYAAKTACARSESLCLSLECLAKARRLFSTNSSYGDSNEVLARGKIFSSSKELPAIISGVQAEARCTLYHSRMYRMHLYSTEFQFLFTGNNSP